MMKQDLYFFNLMISRYVAVNNQVFGILSKKELKHWETINLEGILKGFEAK